MKHPGNGVYYFSDSVCCSVEDFARQGPAHDIRRIQGNSSTLLFQAQVSSEHVPFTQFFVLPYQPDIASILPKWRGGMGHRATWGLMALGICLGASQATAGNSYPAAGLVHSKTDDSALHYDCSLRDNILECDFTQTSVSRQAGPAGQAWRPSVPQRVYFDDKQPTLQECHGYQLLISALKKGQAPIGVGQKEFEEGIAWFASVDGEDLQAVTSFFSEYCKQPSMRQSLKVIRPNRSGGARACSISTRRFSQRFINQPGSGIWSAVDAAPQDCGEVRRDRFVPGKDEAGKPVWTYFASRTISKGSGHAWAGKKCTDTTNIETIFGWQPRDLKLDCDTVSFSLF